jgi:hypothetical protein
MYRGVTLRKIIHTRPILLFFTNTNTKLTLELDFHTLLEKSHVFMRH